MSFCPSFEAPEMNLGAWLSSIAQQYEDVSYHSYSDDEEECYGEEGFSFIVPPCPDWISFEQHIGETIDISEVTDEVIMTRTNLHALPLTYEELIDDSPCTICQKDIDENSDDCIKMPCEHELHKMCLRAFLQAKTKSSDIYEVNDQGVVNTLKRKRAANDTDDHEDCDHLCSSCQLLSHSNEMTSLPCGHSYHDSCLHLFDSSIIDSTYEEVVRPSKRHCVAV